MCPGHELAGHAHRDSAVRRLVGRSHRFATIPNYRRDKRWGHEEISAIVEGSYVGKTLHVAWRDCLVQVGGSARGLHLYSGRSG